MSDNTIDSAIEGAISSLANEDTKERKIICPSCHNRGKIEDYDKVLTAGISGFITLQCKHCRTEFLPNLDIKPKTKDIDIDALEAARQRRKRDGA